MGQRCFINFNPWFKKHSTYVKTENLQILLTIQKVWLHWVWFRAQWQAAESQWSSLGGTWVLHSLETTLPCFTYKHSLPVLVDSLAHGPD